MASKKTLRNKKILITCGPTWIPIDDTRVISNKSTGSLGQTMADDLVKAGANVTVLEGPVTKRLHIKNLNIIKFHFYDEFYKLFFKELKKKYDCVIHAAAVSDYQLKKKYKTKLRSQLSSLELKLVPTKKIINEIKKRDPDVFLVGFKLESKINRKHALVMGRQLIDQAHCDLVIANNSIDNKYSGYILDNEDKILAHETSRQGISKKLTSTLKNLL